MARKARLKAIDTIFHIMCKSIIAAKALAIVLMKSLCNFTSSDITSVLGNITQARISKLSSIGIDLITEEKKYENIIGDFIEYFA